jgi:non-canonical poly(A) RNA polymerase PAPD5/7
MKAATDLMLKTKKAYEESQDYEGVVVEAIAASRPIPESNLPWCVPQTPEREISASDR